MRERYIFSGKLILKTGLHIGGGKYNTSFSDAPVMKTPSGLPYIPGSSFKGVFRSTAERLAGSIPSVKTCFLENDTGNKICLTSMSKKDKKREKYEEFREEHKDDKIEELLEEHLCHTCKLFGSPFKASKAYFSDLYVDEDAYCGGTEVRDGVVIDRDSETARDGLKFDYEVVPSNTAFDFEIVLEDLEEIEFGLFLATLREFENGYAFVGGDKSRGLGNCEISGLSVKMIDFTNADQLKKYLIEKKLNELTRDEVDRLFSDKIELLFS